MGNLLLRSKWGILLCASLLYSGKSLSYGNNSGSAADFSRYLPGHLHKSAAGAGGETPAGRFFQGAVKKEIRGTVTDGQDAMPGVAVFVKSNPSIGTTTDLNGKYVLDVPNAQAVLVEARACASEGVAVAVFPELTLSGYAI